MFDQTPNQQQRAVAQLAERRGSQKAKVQNSRAVDGLEETHIAGDANDNTEVRRFDPPQRDHIPFKRFELRWSEPIGLAHCPYMRRWVLTLFGYSLRLHHWTANDDQRHLHDHAWWMLTIVLCGDYVDMSPAGEDCLRPGSIRFRKAEHRHTVRVGTSGCWSLLLTGQTSRHWGFYVSGRDKLLRPLRYFSRYKHHPCS